MVIVVLAALPFAGNAVAQQTRSFRVGVERNSLTATAIVDTSVPIDRGTNSRRPTHVVKGALIGAAIGAVTGFAAAAIDVHKANVTDHSEDDLTYVLYTITGAFLGAIVGGIVGLVWR
jgi:hypothetical protein